jgi:hypothetical protein
MEEAKRLPQLRIGGQDKPASVNMARAKELPPVGLPSWSGVAVQLILEQFDVDKDGRLDRNELDSLVVGRLETSWLKCYGSDLFLRE